MKPTKTKKREAPDLSKEEISEELGGTTSDPIERQDEGPTTTEGDEGGGGGYGRPRELGEDEPPA